MGPKLKKRLLLNESGTTMVEFAFVAPVLFLLTLSAVEMGVIMFYTNVIEGATYNASRLGKTGYTTGGITREQTILNKIQQMGAGLLDISKVTMTSKVYGTFSNIGDPEPYNDANGNSAYDNGETYSDINGNGQWDADMAASGYGDAGEIVVYTISYPYNVTTPMLKAFLGTNGVYTISALAVVRNEPWNTGT